MGKYFYAMSSNDFFTTLVKTQKKSNEDSWDGWMDFAVLEPISRIKYLVLYEHSTCSIS